MIIGISGKRGAGKDTLAGFLARNAAEFGLPLVEIVGFADPLRYILIEFFGADPELTYGTDEQKQTILPNSAMTYREGLCVIGKGFRDIDPDILTRLAMRKMIRDDRTYVINDMRQERECEEIKRRGGLLIRIDGGGRPGDTSSLECQLDNYSGFDLRLLAEAYPLTHAKAKLLAFLIERGVARLPSTRRG
jgi:hypothetical protein